MNGPEKALHLIQGDLQPAVAARREPPIPQPMDASPWVAMSAMQKAIRRGRKDLALNAATVLRDAPDIWRRVGCIAYEDAHSIIARAEPVADRGLAFGQTVEIAHRGGL